MAKYSIEQVQSKLGEFLAKAESIAQQDEAAGRNYLDNSEYKSAMDAVDAYLATIRALDRKSWEDRR